jgi:ornithine cyclodeaminase/alanine dehydrogenase-like protein (mu-crystallin family)
VSQPREPVARGDVTELGRVLAGVEAGRRSDDDVGVFDSTGLAIQDLAIAHAAAERADELDVQWVDLEKMRAWPRTTASSAT